MDFNTWKEFYGWGFASKEQLQQAVSQGMLTQEQYNEIINPTPVAPIKPVMPTVPTVEKPTTKTEPTQPVSSTVTSTPEVKATEDKTLQNIIG